MSISAELMIHLFPNLAIDGFVETSQATRQYNCIAWAAGFVDDWWWPDANGAAHWPESAPREETLDAFVLAFKTLGYHVCNNGALEHGFEKVAIYAVGGVPRHAARQLLNGNWTSKLGPEIDISHTLRGIEGRHYGSPAVFLKRPRHQQ